MTDTSVRRTRGEDALPELNEDELRVIKQCGHDSLIRRCIPLSAIFMAGAHFGTKNGFFMPHPKYGSLIKVFAASLTGYIVGKFSYIGECKRRLLMLPNSSIAARLRNQRDQAFQQNLPPVADRDDYHMSAPTMPRDVDDRGRDYDTQSTDHNQPSGLDDSNRPTLDSNETTTQASPDDIKPPPPTTTYDELRKKNRDQFPQQTQPPQRPFSRQEFGRRPWTQPQPLGEVRSDGDRNKTPPTKDSPPKTKVKRNKYGDEMD